MSRAFFTLTRDDVSPALSRMARTARRPIEIFRAMGTTFKSLTEGNFNSAGAAYRPKPWPAKKDGSPATLKKSGLLWHSFSLTVTDHNATLSNPTPYATRHQFGDKDGKPMPARPFVPVGADGKLTPAAEEKIKATGERAFKKQIE